MTTEFQPVSNRMLDYADFISALKSDEVLTEEDANRCLSSSPGSRAIKFHPLELIAQHNYISVSGEVINLDFLLSWLATRSSQKVFTIDPLKIDSFKVAQTMSLAFAQRHEILAVEVDDEKVVVASAQPFYDAWEADLVHVLKKRIERVVVSPLDLRRYTTEFYNLAKSVSNASVEDGSTGHVQNFEQMLELGDRNDPDANDKHVANIVDWLLQYAFEQRASDIHIEPRGEKSNVRFRIDGVLHNVYAFPSKVGVAVTSRLKILGRLNVAEKRKPQDGRIKTKNDTGKEIELRLSTLPTAYGEKLVMRIFDPEVLKCGYQELGFSKDDSSKWRGLIEQAHGIILVTGPTGSGKTTSLYATLRELASSEVNVSTIEDPIEMVEGSFNQMQVQSNIDLNFAEGVRALMRQDPDIIMIGEIRDAETAEMAVQSALTGHLVLSTLHTNDAPSSVSRLLELGVPAYLIRATLLGIMAQRLVRTLCEHCKSPIAVDSAHWSELAQPWKVKQPEHIYEANGCKHCRETGYKGRAGVYEIMPFSESLKHQIEDSTDISALRKQAIKEGMHSLRLSALKKVALGQTTIEEVLRVTPIVPMK